MAATYAIVYATASKMHRRTIADDEGQISLGVMPDNVTPAVVVGHSHAPPSLWPLSAGETAILVTVPPNAVTADGTPQWLAAIQAATGIAPPQLTCALIDGTNTVQHMVVADPAIDAAPTGFTMVLAYSPLVTTGCTYDPVAGLFTAPAYTIPAGAPGNHGTALPKNVAAAVIPRP
jgi:hypothetical protein